MRVNVGCFLSCFHKTVWNWGNLPLCFAVAALPLGCVPERMLGSVLHSCRGCVLSHCGVDQRLEAGIALNDKDGAGS